VCAATVYAANEPASETKEQREARLHWWRDARFGMFIHWGPVSLKGTEIGWSRGGERRGVGGTGEIPLDVYDTLYTRFNPVKFDAGQWVAIAKAAGMKYMVFTSRHHDGFSMFATKQGDYTIMHSPFKRDVVAELAAACHKAGIRFGLYYSQPDWHHPDYMTSNHATYIAYMHGQVRELLSNYGTVDVIWFDGLGGDAKRFEADTLFPMIRSLQPRILVNNRCGLDADFDTPEQSIGGFNRAQPWETCMTICTQWAWRPNDKMKSLEQCLRTLIACAGGDGNLLFNVGPMPTGEIEPRQVERLADMGRWLGKYGDAIYGTRGGPFKPGAWGASTCKGNRIFLHVFSWPGDTLVLPPITPHIRSAKLRTGGAVTAVQTTNAVSVTVLPGCRQEIDTLIELTLDSSAEAIEPIAVAKPVVKLADGSMAKASNVYQDHEDFGPDKAFDGIAATRWATDSGTETAWIELDYPAPRTFRGIAIDEWSVEGARVKAFELQHKVGSEWKTIFAGTTIGTNYTHRFEPVKVTCVRLNITSASEGPTISEIRLEE